MTQIKHNNYKFSQSFGAENESAPVQPEDLISSLSFSEKGRLLAVGDCGGRIVIFRKKSKASLPQFDAVCEYTAFNRDFDILRSQEISPEILGLQFLTKTQNAEHILACTERDVKIFKIVEKINVYKQMHNEQFPKATVKNQITINPELIFSNASQFHINSLCVSPAQDSFLIADDFTITQFHVNDNTTGFQLINNRIDQLDIKLNLITTATYHPQDQNLIFAGYSSGQMKLYDLRADLKQTSMQSVGNMQPIHDIQINSPNLIFQRTSQSIVINDIRNLNKSLFSMNLNPKLNIKEKFYHNSQNQSYNTIETYQPKILQNEHDIRFNLSISKDQQYWASGYYGSQLLIGNLQNDVIQFKTTRLLKKQSKSVLPGSQLGSKLVASKGVIQQNQFSDQMAGRVEKTLFADDCLVAASGGNLFVYGWQ